MSTSREFGLERGKVFPYEAARGLLNPLRRLIIRPAELVRWMNVAPHHRVLELGCGPGYFSPALVHAAFDGMVVLFDLQLEMLGMATDGVGDSEVCRAVQGDAVALPFASGSFDRVLMVTVLGETGQPAACLREVHRVLRPDGRLVTVEQRGDPDRITPSEIAVLAAEADLTITRQRRGRLWFSHYAELAP